MENNWAELTSAFDRLAGLDIVSRGSALAEIERQNPNLAKELASLLNAHDAADGFLEDKVADILDAMTVNMALNPGDRLLHFEIVDLLGEGSHGRVYLCKDTELERQVALKVTLNQSKEARTLAHFSIDGIVQVHSEHVVEKNGVPLRLICLQYVEGPTLAKLAIELENHPQKKLIEVLDQCCRRKVALEPTALKWREALSSLDNDEALVFLGIRLAEILHHAHEAQVLHLDIKPANILIDPYGRPYLSDFNVSTYSARLSQGDVNGMGGTPHFMSPEQAEFFRTPTKEYASQLSGQSDVYGLGTVLRDLLKRNADPNLQQILLRATEAEMNLRTACASTLAQELSSWLRGKLAEKEMPAIYPGFKWILSHPMWAIIWLTMASQMVASAINIGYNRLQIVSELTRQQHEVFLNCVLFYNSITYPLTLICSFYALRALFLPHSDLQHAKETALRVPRVVFLAISLGWLPGAAIFPLAIDIFAGPISQHIYFQFAASFSLAWLISMTTTMTLVIFVQVRGLYPRYGVPRAEQVGRELRNSERLNKYLTFAAATIPMAGGFMMICLAPAEFSVSDYRSFKIFLMATIGFGLVNLAFVQRLTQMTESSVAALKRPRPFA